MAKGRSKPRIEDMEEGLQHSYDHRGDKGKYGDIYKEDVERWKKIAEDEHELCIVPYLCKENSVFREKNPDFNRPFDNERLKSGNAWAHKLTVLLHYNVGVNQDTVACPRTCKMDCPLCEERNEIFDLIDKETDKDRAMILQKRADRLGTTKRALYNVFIFSSEKEMRKGVQIWEAPHESIEDVLSDLYADERTGDKRYYTIPEECWNVRFERKGTGKEGTKYKDVKIVKRLEKDEFSAKEMDELYAMAYNLDEMVDLKSYSALKDMIKGGAASEEAEGPEDKEDRTDRFRGRDRAEERKEEEELKEDVGEAAMPDKYQDCFGIMNGKRSECEDCPKELWKACLKKSEEKKASSRVSRDGGRRNGSSRVGRRNLD